MKHRGFITLSLLLLPAVALAQTLQSFLGNLLVFLNNVIVPFLVGIAFLIFVFNAVRYFVVQGGSQEGAEKARALALYSVLAFVVIVIFWGIINLVVSSIGLVENQPPSDYEQWKNPPYCPPEGGPC